MKNQKKKDIVVWEEIEFIYGNAWMETICILVLQTSYNLFQPNLQNNLKVCKSLVFGKVDDRSKYTQRIMYDEVLVVFRH